MPTTWIADIANWQRGISVEQIAAEGYAAIVCKASEGVTFNDREFDDWIPRIKAAGAIPGAYHYIRNGDGAAQARHFLDRLAPHGGPDGFLIQLDCEADASYDTVRAWVDEWNARTGNHPFLLYTGGWWWRPRGWDGAALTPYLWHSQYVAGADVGSRLFEQVPDAWWTPGYGGWEQATLLQFSSTALVAGQRIDVSAFRGTVDELRALTRPTGIPAPQRAPEPPGFPGRLLVLTRPLMRGDDVRQWQQQMQDRGWRIDVDGVYGPQSAGVAEQFQREKNLQVDGLVGPQTWGAAWTAPIT